MTAELSPSMPPFIYGTVSVIASTAIAFLPDPGLSAARHRARRENQEGSHPARSRDVPQGLTPRLPPSEEQGLTPREEQGHTPETYTQAPTQRGAGAYPRSHIQAGVALRRKPKPPFPGQGSLSRFPQLTESLESFLGLPAPGRGRCLRPRAGSWAQPCLKAAHRGHHSSAPRKRGTPQWRQEQQSGWSCSRPPPGRGMDSEHRERALQSPKGSQGPTGPGPPAQREKGGWQRKCRVPPL